MSLTLLAKEGLQWFADHNGAAWFDRASPTNAMRRRLERDGLIKCSLPSGGVGMLRWYITPIGLDTLKRLNK